MQGVILNLTMTEEQTLLKDSVLRWAQENVQGGPSRWNAMGNLGWLGMTVSEAYGGSGQGLAEACVLAESLGSVPIVENYALFVTVAAGFIDSAGSASQRDDWLPKIAAGSMKLAPAHFEMVGSRGVDSMTDSMQTRAVHHDGYWLIDGDKRPVAGDATHYLLSAKADSGIVFFVMPREVSGLQIREVSAVDGGRVAILSLAQVKLEESARLTEGTLKLFLAMHDRATVVACAEQVGSMKSALQATIEYTRTRQQFSQPLSANQVIRHRLADMLIACEEAQSMVLGATLEIEAAEYDAKADGFAYARAASLARVKVSKLALRVLEEAIQLHGGMGVTDELSIAHYLRRHLALDAWFGDSSWHLKRFAGLPERPSLAATGMGQDPTLVSFRDEVQHFLKTQLSQDLTLAARLNTSVFSEPSVSLAWQRKLYAQGWVAPAWPVEYGGTGWSLAQRWIFETELAQAGAPSLSPLGLRMAGPVIMKFGTPEQKAHYLPRLLAGDDYWCQGYSEPGSGSDLASLKMRAQKIEVAGEEVGYRINGSKIWTSHAQHANRMFALVRTGDAQTRKQDGISFLLIDMGLPGITVRPILSASGDHEVNQVFFDDVKVPVSCRLGEEGQGWKIAKYLLEFERGGAITAGQLRAALNEAKALFMKRSLSESLHPEVLQIAGIEADIRALEMTELRIMSSLTVGQNPGHVSSMLKLRWSEIHQDITRLNLRLLGSDALMWEHHRPLHLHHDEAVLEDGLRPLTAGYLNARAFTIFGGTSEIQREIIARELVG
jgi:alkylation response protein AidB-like acyl-CoA dehydrogenase